jgi:1-acyl-sn-glycerol-3-phosphate acyltransferase
MNKFVATISRALMAGTIRRHLIKEIKGWENIPKKGNFILASNHLSHMDWFMSGYIATPRKFTFIAQVDQYTGFKKLWRNVIYLYGGIIPINRKSDESKKQAIETAIKMLKHGYCVVIYPEGGRAYDGVMRDFKSGVGKLHLDSGIPVLPVALKGTNELMPPHGRLKFKKTARISIGKPLNFPKEREMAEHLDKESKEYHNLCANVAALIEREVRELAKKQY